ncbi:putative transcriptional regulator [Prauserella halophila]|nr:putative transcriptional regulator [Prauserella halophila]
MRQVRRAVEVTQAQLAEAAGVARQTVVAMERDDYAPSVYLALAVARYLDTTVEALFAPQGEATDRAGEDGRARAGQKAGTRGESVDGRGEPDE